MKVFAIQNDNLDAIIYRYFGRVDGLLEPTLALNPHLTDNAIIEMGTEVNLPDEATIKQGKTIQSVNLWD